MDSFELNKIIGAILGTLLFIMGAGFLAEAIYAPIEDRGPGYELPEPELVADAGEEIAEEPQIPLGTLLASANVEQGEAASRKCQSCHNFEQGAGNKQGPELFGVAGRQIASFEGFSFSDVLAEMGAAGETWTYDHLDAFLLAPNGFAPGTKMNFGGIKDPEERANVVAYLASISPDAPAFPVPEPAEDATAEAQAGVVPAEEGVTITTEGDAVEAATETQDESPVEGTPITETLPTDDTAPDGGDAAAGEDAAAPAGDGVVPEVPAE